MESLVERGSKLPIVGIFCRWLIYRASMKELMSLDKSTMKDLGITPYDFRAIAAGVYHRPSDSADPKESRPSRSHAPVEMDSRRRSRNRTG